MNKTIVYHRVTPLTPPFCSTGINFCYFKMYKYKSYCIQCHIMPPSGLGFPDSMPSTQKWPEQGWAFLQLLLVACFSHSEEICKRRGDPENPQLSKNGDIILGGMFSFHSSWKDRKDNYMQKPLPLQCTRYNIAKFYSILKYLKVVSKKKRCQVFCLILV